MLPRLEGSISSLSRGFPKQFHPPEGASAFSSTLSHESMKLSCCFFLVVVVQEHPYMHISLHITIRSTHIRTQWISRSAFLLAEHTVPQSDLISFFVHCRNLNTLYRYCILSACVIVLDAGSRLHWPSFHWRYCSISNKSL